jgi:hypothetical protein
MIYGVFAYAMKRLLTKSIHLSFFAYIIWDRAINTQFFFPLCIIQVPYLIDPNTGAEIGDYKKILAYLFQTYSAAAT